MILSLLLEPGVLASASGAEDGLLSILSRSLIAGHQSEPFVSVNCCFRIGSFGVVFPIALLLLEPGMLAASSAGNGGLLVHGAQGASRLCQLTVVTSSLRS